MRGFFSALAFVSLAVTACAPGVQPLLEEYNALFPRVTERGQEDGELPPHEWFPDSITMSYASTLNLNVPANYDSYKWELTGLFGEEGEIPDGFNIALYGGATSYLALNFKAAGFSFGSVYELTCTVERNGQTISDSCKIILVE